MTVNDAAAWPANEQRSPARRVQPSVRVHISLEVVLYLVLAALSLVLRLTQLGLAPLDDVEASQALAALHAVNPQVPGEASIAASPVTYVSQAAAFTFLGQNEFTARLPVALAGVLLTLSPWLWRRYLNPLPPLIISLLLTISPVAQLSSRTGSPVVWTMLLAVVAPWLVLRFVETRREGWAVAATAALASMVLLVEPAGGLTLLALGFGVVFAWLTDENPAVMRSLREVWRGWPWSNSVLVSGVLVLAVATGLFWLPSGLTTVGNTIWTGFQGFTVRPAGAPIAFPLWVVLRYEGALLAFGLLACWNAVRDGGFFERALAGWFLAGMVWALGYAGATAAHALWMVLPLTVLVGLMVTQWITERAQFMWEVPSWGVPLHAVITLGLWLAVGVSLLLLAKRLLIDLPAGVDDFGALARKLAEGVFSRNTQQPETTSVQEIPLFAYVLGYIQLRLLITLLVSLLIAVLFFLVGSLWGARASWRGLALGTLAFGLLFSAGLGGRAAHGKPGDPREFWHLDPVTADAFELRTTLIDMSLRDTGEPRLIDIAALTPDDGALAWALRDFPNTRFVDGIGPEVSNAIVLMPAVDPQPPMGADYVGKDLIIRLAWNTGQLSWRDALMWFYRSDSQFKPVPGEVYMLWVRKDVYGVERVE